MLSQASPVLLYRVTGVLLSDCYYYYFFSISLLWPGSNTCSQVQLSHLNTDFHQLYCRSLGVPFLSTYLLWQEHAWPLLHWALRWSISPNYAAPIVRNSPSPSTHSLYSHTPMKLVHSFTHNPRWLIVKNKERTKLINCSIWLNNQPQSIFWAENRDTAMTRWTPT